MFGCCWEISNIKYFYGFGRDNFVFLVFWFVDINSFFFNVLGESIEMCFDFKRVVFKNK